MLLSELFESVGEDEEEPLYEVGAKIAWSRQGGKLTRKFRCTQGPRKGRIVNSPVDCGKPIDPQKRQRFRVARAKQAPKAAARAKVTKKRDPTSRVVRKLNKLRSRNTRKTGKQRRK